MTNIDGMGETFEAAYYASVVDELTVANELLRDNIEQLKQRASHGDKSTELIREYLRCLDDGNTIEPVTFQMHQHLS